MCIRDRSECARPTRRRPAGTPRHPPMRCRFSTAAATGAALMLSACASNSIGAGGIDAATKAQLQQDVQTLTQAAQHRQYSGAQTALSTLNADLTAAHAAGKVTDAKLLSLIHISEPTRPY